MKPRIRIASVAGLLVAATVGVVAYAAIPDSGGVIHGCYKNTTGQLRVIDSATEACGNNETPLAWSQTGPEGPAGPPGPVGPEGQPGPPALSGYEVVLTDSQTNSSDRKTVISECPDGKRVLGGGASAVRIGTMTSNLAVDSTQPLARLDGWFAAAHEVTSGDGVWRVSAFAICANVVP
jgi:hypothetical protein